MNETVAEKQSPDKEILISVAAKVHNQESIIAPFIQEVTDILRQHYVHYEFIIIDNGSTDSTVAKVKELQKVTANIRLIILSKKYEDEIVYAAALDNCIGDYTVLLDPNYDPPHLIPQLVEKCRSGYDVTFAERKERREDSWWMALSARIFYAVSKILTGYPLKANYSDFFCLSRRAINSITRIRNRTRYLKYLIHEIGFSRTAIRYERINRSGQPRRRDFLQSLDFATQVMVYNSEKPIRVAALLAILVSFLNLLYVGYIILIFIFKKDVAEGWTSSQLTSAVMFFLLFVILAIFGEYIARILEETKKSDLYFTADESNSSVLPGKDNKNII